MTANEVIAQLEQAAADLSVEEMGVVLGGLERLKAGLWAKLVTPAHNGKAQPLPSTEPDKLLSPEAAAALLGVKVTWLYRHAKTLPFDLSAAGTRCFFCGDFVHDPAVAWSGNDERGQQIYLHSESVFDCCPRLMLDA